MVAISPEFARALAQRQNAGMGNTKVENPAQTPKQPDRPVVKPPSPQEVGRNASFQALEDMTYRLSKIAANDPTEENQRNLIESNLKTKSMLLKQLQGGDLDLVGLSDFEAQNEETRRVLRQGIGRNSPFNAERMSNLAATTARRVAFAQDPQYLNKLRRKNRAENVELQLNLMKSIGADVDRMQKILGDPGIAETKKVVGKDFGADISKFRGSEAKNFAAMRDIADAEEYFASRGRTMPAGLADSIWAQHYDIDGMKFDPDAKQKSLSKMVDFVKAGASPESMQSSFPDYVDDTVLGMLQEVADKQDEGDEPKTKIFTAAEIAPKMQDYMDELEKSGQYGRMEETPDSVTRKRNPLFGGEGQPEFLVETKKGRQERIFTARDRQEMASATIQVFWNSIEEEDRESIIRGVLMTLGPLERQRYIESLPQIPQSLANPEPTEGGLDPETQSRLDVLERNLGGGGD